MSIGQNFVAYWEQKLIEIKKRKTKQSNSSKLCGVVPMIMAERLDLMVQEELFCPVLLDLIYVK